MLMRLIYFFAILLVLISCNDRKGTKTIAQENAPTSLYMDSVVVYPHDTTAFTQGLQYYKGKLYESTGDYENSSIRITQYQEGKILTKNTMGTKEIFGEGITIFRNQIFQLTWRSNLVFVYNINDIKNVVQTYKWPKEGWGITNDGESLIISDGSSILYFIDPTTFSVRRQIQAVINNTEPIERLNELEFINGFIFANVFEKNIILKIRPDDGKVMSILDCSELITTHNLTFPQNPEKVLNGIAYDSLSNRYFITGKLWPVLFESYLR